MDDKEFAAWQKTNATFFKKEAVPAPVPAAPAKAAPAPPPVKEDPKAAEKREAERKARAATQVPVALKLLEDFSSFMPAIVEDQLSRMEPEAAAAAKAEFAAKRAAKRAAKH